MGKFSINKIVRTLISADLIFLSAFGLITPIFAVFITEQIKGGNIEVVGFAAAVYWIIKSLLQIPIGNFLDKRKGEKDDLYFLVFGYLIVGLVPFGYLSSFLPWHIYVLEGIYAIGMAMAIPSWCAIFTRHIDKGKEGFEWSLESTAFSFGTGVTGALGGILVSKFGFDVVFVIVGIFALIGALLPLFIYKDITQKGDGFLRFFKSKLFP
ncbi:MAG: MFS transporter [Patescibacteria group bacterium]